MAPLTKDSIEVAGSAAEIAAPRPAAQPKPATAAGHLRSDALSLEVPVKVHGSRLSDAPNGAAPHTEPFEEQTTTMIVFPHGCVIRMSTAVNVGQMLVVTNLKTRQDAICRTVKVRTFTNMQSYVEVEFTHKQEGYWNAQFSANAPAVAAPVLPQPSASSSAPASISAPAASVPAPLEKQAYVPAPAPAEPVIATIQKPAFVPPPPPAIAPAVTPAPVVNTSHVAPLPPPTFVPPPPPPVAPVVQSTYVAPPPAPPVAKQESSFVWIGTQEEVQPAASATSITKPGAPSLSPRPAAPVRQAPPLEIPKLEIPKVELPKAEISKPAASVEEMLFPPSSSATPFSTALEPAPVAPLTMSELRGDAPVAAAIAPGDSVRAAEPQQSGSVQEKPAESSRAVFGSLSGGASFGASRTASPEAFGSRLDSAIGSSEDSQGPGKSTNWMLIAVCLGVLFACVAGGVLYFRSQSNGGANANSLTRPQSTSQSQEVSAEQSALQNSAQGTPVNGPVATAIPSGAPTVTVSAGTANSSGSSAKTNSAVKQTVNKIASLMSGTDDHPVTAQRSDASTPGAAPSVDAAPAIESSDGNALGGIIPSSPVAAPVAPEIRPEGPVVIGGKVAEPKLIYRALPVYPVNAKQAGVAGDVVVKTTIDQKGGVVDMHVVSGPLMLRQAALDALHRWKFEPSKLDGQPIAVQMLVTIRFSR